MPLPGQKPDASAAADKLRTARCNKKPGSKADVPRNTPHTARSSEDETARKFWQHLASDEELRLQCEDLVQFGAALQHFKSVVSPGSKGCPSAVRYACSRLKLAAKRGSVLLLRHRDETADAWEQRRADHSEYESARRRIGAARAESDKDKHGLKVTPGDILVNNAINVGSKMSWKIQIVNASTTTRVLDDVQVQGQSSQTWSLTPGQDRLRGSELLPGHSLSMELGVCPTGIGFYRLKLVFLFSEGFHITRMIELPIGNKDLLRILEPTAPFTRKKKEKKENVRHFVPGEPIPLVHNAAPFETPIPNFGIPGSAAHDDRAGTRALKQILTGMDKLDSKNYRRFFQTLLWLEELQMLLDISSFDIEDAVLKRDRKHRFLALAVPGLAENRPSVLKGDHVYVRVHDANKWYQGVAHHIALEEVHFAFHREFHDRIYLNNMRVHVRFSFSRVPLRLQHQGLAMSSGLGNEVLFPAMGYSIKAARKGARLLPTSRLNEEQQAAVACILEGLARPTPYIIYGPPGTGKTTTLVEVLRQCCQRSDTRILMCAKSNEAADLVVKGLGRSGITPKEMIRIMAFSRDVRMWPDDVKPYAKVNPSLHEIIGFKVVVATLAIAAKLHNWGVSMGHFDTICIDEAGQATEPEVMGVVAPLLNSRSGDRAGQLVMAGDPKQLGPIVHSSECETRGLALSFLERLMQLPPYARDIKRHGEGNRGHDPLLISKLVRNYRSHPVILELPNELFYDGDLIQAADRVMTHRLQNWEHLPVKGHPMFFHAIFGKDEREANSPSWFNKFEALQVVEYVRLLTRETRPPVPRNEIAVITPYHKMAMKIEDGLRASGLSGVLVGSTERLQGQERRVVIISTVRSNPDHLAFDTKHLLGFVGNPKRFNVAITRAMALLIVVGNPDILSRDPNWHALLHRCAKKGSWVGEGMRQAIDAPPPRAASAGGDCALSNGFAALSLGNSGNGPEETGEEDGNPSHQMEEGRSWQRDE